MIFKNVLSIVISVATVSSAFSFEKNSKAITKDLGIKSEKLLPTAIHENDKTKFGHVIKWNVSQLMFKNISLQYEFAFHKNMSFALGYTKVLKKEVPKQIFKSEEADSAGYKLPGITGGFSLTPEFRFYPGKKEEKQAPHGFYLAPYMRYSIYKMSAGFTDRNDNKYDFKGVYKGSTFGLMIGSQWIAGKHFSFDWWILGAGVGRSTLELTGTTTATLPQDYQDALNSDISKNIQKLDRFANGDIDIAVTSNSAKVGISGIPMFSLRGMLVFGLNFGYKF